MARLFAQLYLDEDVSILIADLLRARGFHAVTTRDAQQLGASDREQLEFAAQRQMAVLTHNRVDFEALHQGYVADAKEHWGILIAARRRPPLLVARLLLLLNRLTADELKNQLIYL